MTGYQQWTKQIEIFVTPDVVPVETLNNFLLDYSLKEFANDSEEG